MTAPAISANWKTTHGFLLGGLLLLAPGVPALRTWPHYWLAPLAAYAILVATVPPLRASFGCFRFGKLTRSTIAATVVLVLVSCATLIAYQSFAHPDARAIASVMPVQSLGGVVSAGIAFSLLNASAEEVVFRGVLFDAAEAQCGGWGAILLTAALFGYGHRSGYPPDWLGASLAGLYGLALGWLRWATGGLALPIAAHIAADATIYSILLRSGALAD